MNDAAAQSTVFLRDYAPPPFLIPQVELDIDFVSEEEARIRTQLAVKRNPAAERATELKLDLDEVTVESVAMNGDPLSRDRYKLDAHHLTVPVALDACVLTRLV